MLTAVISVSLDYNSDSARLERAVAQIVEEYGLELQSELPGYFNNPRREFTKYRFTGSPISAEETEEIVAILRSASDSGRYERTVIPSGSVLLVQVHNVFIREQDSWNPKIKFTPYTVDASQTDSVPEATLILFDFEEPSLLERLKELWPW